MLALADRTNFVTCQRRGGARHASSKVRSVARDTTPASCASLIISWIAPAISLR
jgi:hypothetical protein